MQVKKFGVYVGRFSPLHLGHEAVIDQMISEFGSRCILFIGSPNLPMSRRHMFSYGRRVSLIHRVYPDLNRVALPDFKDNPNWVLAILDMLKTLGYTKDEVLFYGGSPECVKVLSEYGFNVKVIDRTSGETPVVSATEIKAKLATQQPITGLVNAKNEEAIIAAYMYADMCLLKQEQDDKRSVESECSDSNKS